MAPLPPTRHSLLVRLTEPHDSAAWAEFVETYEAPVLRYCRSRGLQESDARDAVQEVLLAVHAAAADWQPTGRPGGFRKWLLRTAHNHCLKSLRKRSRGDGGVFKDDSQTARFDQYSQARTPLFGRILAPADAVRLLQRFLQKEEPRD
jgi:RNA polymerase sigma-70 factor (ECF subfamily)